jgi:hypothetical protein
MRPDSWPDLPDLKIDTTLLHLRYWWNPYLDLPSLEIYGPFKWGGAEPGDPRQIPLPPGLRALPEVNWASRSYGTEVLYLYKSWYGASHPLGETFNYQGSPVAHRLNAGIYRTAHFCFTPLAMDSIPMQQVLNGILEWLYEPDILAPPTEMRYSGSKVALPMAQARALHWKRIEDAMIDEDAKISYREVGLWR